VKLLTIVILFLILLTVNFLLRKIIRRLKIQNELHEYINRYFPIVELIVWTIFIIWASNALFRNSEFHLYVNFLTITLGFVLISWFFIKDYISGVQIKSRFNLSSGQIFKSEQIKGVVKKIGLLLLEVKAENGGDFKIPYSQIDQKSIELNIQEKSGGENTFIIVLDKKLNETTTVHRLTEMIINSPWSSYKSTPVIKVADVENNLKSYEISCISNGKNGTKRLKEIIEREFGLKI